MSDIIPIVNQDKEHIINNIRCFALDMDGTIYLGEKWIAGAVDFLKKIEESGRQYVFLTNNSSKNAAVYVEKLHRMGLDRLSAKAFFREKGIFTGQSASAERI